uniref:disease resistance protein RUN1-like n=1 Tax=Erigeron canadensis TaxID=72917 RepID=UPI001CB9B6C1|nr:disease resistance protein RUN1-like [Erigeron canadensis]
MLLRSPNPSSSSSHLMSNCSYSYDVFLSFRGEDTRKAFTDHLYTALKQAGIRTFRDDDAMERGRLVKPELEKAIRQSQVLLIVFSKGYATSKWCLDEVLMIMEQYDEERSSTSTRRQVVPVFYNMDPADVRNQTGCFEEAFKVYDDEVTRETDLQKKKELSEKVEAWRSSLKRVGSVAGLVLGENGYEAEFISNIVNDIRQKVDYNALYIRDKLVGMKEDVVEIELWLQDPSPSSTILLIHGMGGIGKTTIAKCVYNKNCREYDGCCFLKSINENGLLRLQSQLLSTICKSQKEETIWNEDEGTTKIMKAIHNKKVLLVLDDVATPSQLDALLGPETLYSGSKVIITTRHMSLLTAFTVPPKVKTIKTLSTNDSVELFSLYAFPQNQPIEPYYSQSEQVRQVIHYCKGLPLALKVLGSNLRGKNNAQWKDAMSKLEKYPLDVIQRVLQLSYDSLEDQHDKDLFLHIACFFVGKDEDFIVSVLGECKLYPIIGIKNLIDRSLLYIESGKVEMHQLIRDMGKEVVRQESPKDPGKRSRLWEHEDCINVLQENVGSKYVEGFSLDMENIGDDKLLSAMKMRNPMEHGFEKYIGITMPRNETNFNIRSFEKMKNLMLLQLNHVTIAGKYKKLPKKLRLLSWHGFSLKSIPGDVPLEKLVVLDMSYSKLERVWDDFKSIDTLYILNLSYSVKLIKTPDFGGLPGLKSLILKGCTSLSVVDKSIAYLEGLVLLDLTNCRSLRNIPCLPTSLVSLKMSGCPNLGAVGRFECSGSTLLPSLLVELNISNCHLSDNSFPNDWSNLVSLLLLNIDRNNVTNLPKCIQSLPRLQWLGASQCSHIKSVLRPPKTLTFLDIKYNKSLVKVQVSHGEHTVWSSGCQNLSCIEGRFKWQTIDKVERKIIQNMGLGSSNAYGGIDFKQKVVFEYGIFSTCVTQEQIPSSCFFMFKERGSQISFIVPSHHHRHRIISGFTLCLVFSSIPDNGNSRLFIELYNKTKELEWLYVTGTLSNNVKERKIGGWISVWRCDNLLHAGNEIFVRIVNRFDEVSRKVEECCVNLIYEDDEDVGDMKEGNDNVVISSEYNDDEIIRWSDKAYKDISNYVHPDMEYRFGLIRDRGYDLGLDYDERWQIFGDRRSKGPINDDDMVINDDNDPDERWKF